MKITKNKVIQQNTNLNCASSKYIESSEYIKAAIESLATCSKDDKIAKESIANLSVVLFDLQ